MFETNNWIEDQQVINDKSVDTTPEPEIEIADITPEPDVPESIIGTVIDCPRLNVRIKPRADAYVICTIDRDSKVMIDEENSTNDFYKICTELGIEGYCMKQFISTLA